MSSFFLPIIGNKTRALSSSVSQKMFPDVSTKDPLAVAALARATMRLLHPQANTAVIGTLFRDLEDIFGGRYLDYLPLDTRYHDFEHTLQATLCLIQLLAGRARAGVNPVLSPRQFEIGIAAVLLHDTGYLKLRSDRNGTGAKYTFVHVVRSCAFAASYLPTVGFTNREVETVENAIRCTGPGSDIRHIGFAGEAEQFLGCALSTADFLGQMAAPDYVDELPFLYAEFRESDDFFHVPPEKRAFRSLRELIEKTPPFWEKVVLPRIRDDYRGIYRYLDDPFPGGPNAYIEAIERNIARTKSIVRDAVTPAAPG